MDTDLILVIGIVVVGLSIPSLLAAFSTSHPPRFGAVMLLIGGALVAVALTRHSPAYRFEEMPALFTRVLGRYLN
jgi:formate-dependent nitrite reductase membrane component NrfD